MDIQELFNSRRLADYPNNRLSHPALAIPDDAPVYNLATGQDGIILTRGEEPVDISQVPDLPDWLVMRFRYWETAFNYACSYSWEDRLDPYELEAYGISIAADMADTLNGRARIQYCGMGIHSEAALDHYFTLQHYYADEEGGKHVFHDTAHADTVELPKDAPLTQYMVNLRREGQRQNGAFDATYFGRDVGRKGCIPSIKLPGGKEFCMDTRLDNSEVYVPYWLVAFCINFYEDCDLRSIDTYRPKHPWLFTLREDAMLVDLALELHCNKGIARANETHRIIRPFWLGN